MENYDLVIRGGRILDGSGGESFVGDVAIRNGRICDVGDLAGRSGTEIDAAGKLVMPGFVDIHTHYDGQATWDNRFQPSSDHGVTTVVMGNCGVGFAPCKPDEHDLLIKVMEGVEDIPEIVLTEGIPWTWQTFPEYLDFLSARKFDIDCFAYLPHAALRVFVMGERAVRREPSTAQDRKRMTDMVTEAINAGAIGVSTSRLLSHRDSGGNLAPHVQTAREELFALAEGLCKAGSGTFQIAAAIANQQLTSVIPDAAPLSPDEAVQHEVDLLTDICRASGRPLTFALSIINDMPEIALKALDLIDEANRQPGIDIVAQIFPRPIGMLFGLDLSLNPFQFHPGYKAIENLPLADRVREMRKPEVRARILSEEPDQDHPNPIQRFLVMRSIEGYAFADEPDYEPDPASSLKAIAERQGKTVWEIAYDALLEHDGKAILFLPINNYPGSLDQVGEMLARDGTVMALGDAGAHLGLISDASYPTYVLTYWVRDRTAGNGHKMGLPEAVHGLTQRAASTVGLTDRGLIAPGMKADINIVDYDSLHLGAPQATYDLPAGGRRVRQPVSGFEATIVSGEIILRNGEPTGALPGRLVRANEITA